LLFISDLIIAQGSTYLLSVIAPLRFGGIFSDHYCKFTIETNGQKSSVLFCWFAAYSVP